MATQRTTTVRDLAAVLAGLRDADEVYDMLLALLTPREREELALRWQLVLLLQAGLTQRAIAARLGVSLCKITRGARELKRGPAGFRRVAKRVEKGAGLRVQSSGG